MVDSDVGAVAVAVGVENIVGVATVAGAVDVPAVKKHAVKKHELKILATCPF